MCSPFEGTRERSIRPIADVKIIALRMYTSVEAKISGMLRLLRGEYEAGTMPVIILIFHERGLIYKLEISRNPNYRLCHNSMFAGLLFVLFSSWGKCNYHIARGLAACELTEIYVVYYPFWLHLYRFRTRLTLDYYIRLTSHKHDS